VQRIRDRLKILGRRQKELAAFLGIKESRLSDCLNGKNQFKTIELPQMAAFLKWSPAELLAVIADPLPSQGEVKTMPLTVSREDLDLPVLGAEEVGGGIFTLSAEAVAVTSRPVMLRQSKNSFAFRVVSDAMYPALERGTLIFIDPTIPAAVGENALFVSAPGADGKIRYTVRRILDITEAHWRVKQWKPEKTVNLARSEWPTAHKVMGTRSR